MKTGLATRKQVQQRGQAGDTLVTDADFGATSLDTVSDSISGTNAAQERVVEDGEYDTTLHMAEVTAPEAADAEVAGQILGMSRTAFKEGVARTTIRLYEGATPLTLIEEKLEGDASVMMREPRKRTWLLDTLRDVERRTGMKLFRTAEDAQITDGDIKEAWSHLGQYYFVGRAKHGDAATLARWKEKGFREMFADIMGSKAGPTMQAYETFFRSVWRRGAELEEMRRAGTLDGDLEGTLKRALGMDGGQVSAMNTTDENDASDSLSQFPMEAPMTDIMNGAIQGREVFHVEEEAADLGAEFSDNWGEISFSLGPQELGAPSPMRDASGKINVEGWRSTKLKGALAAHDSRFKDLIDDREHADAIYRQIPETKGGKVLGTDLSRMIDENYRTSREWRIDYGRATVHAAAIDAADRLFRELASPNGRTKILFTAGGVGAGKSTVVDDAMIADYDLVFDGTLRNTAEAIQSIEYAIDHGWTVDIQYVQRPIGLALKGVVNRADELGRWGPITDVPQAHLDAQKSIVTIAKHFANEPRVTIEYWYNDDEIKGVMPKVINLGRIQGGGDLSLTAGDFIGSSRKAVVETFREAVRNRGKAGEPGDFSEGSAVRFDPVVLERLARPDLELQAIFWQEVLSGNNQELKGLNQQQRNNWAIQEAKQILRLPDGTPGKAVMSRLDNDTRKRWKQWLQEPQSRDQTGKSP
ncbi:zeta toxin [Roseimicrobium gellanilyticum]|uniref:Zeta toxin n=1 Tax=Roseimicrobium gellanilyticum TaxID=748857 RepID=A0A366H4T2_9BACT|nr:zeta toxin [Roseimicrobium gellanilyticum]